MGVSGKWSIPSVMAILIRTMIFPKDLGVHCFQKHIPPKLFPDSPHHADSQALAIAQARHVREPAGVWEATIG